MRTLNLSLAISLGFFVIQAGLLRGETPPTSEPLPKAPIARLRGHQSHVWSLAFSPDGKTLATGSEDKTIRLWELPSGKERQRIAGHRWGVQSLAFSPDGKTLLSESGDQVIRQWDISGPRRLHEFKGHQDTVVAFVFATDGQSFASWSLDRTIRLWSTTTGKEFQQLKGHQDQIAWVAFSPDGRNLASWGTDQTIRLWDIATGQQGQRFQGEAWQLYFLSDSRIVALDASDPMMRLWNVRTGELVCEIGTRPSRLRPITFAPDGRTVAIGDGKGVVRLIEVATGQERCRFQGHSHEILSVAFSADGRMLAAGSLDQEPILVWDVTGQKQLRPTRLSSADLGKLWKTDLAGADGGQAHQAIWTLVRSSDEAVLFLKDRLRSVPAADPERVKQLIADLDSGQFAGRQKAEEELERLGERARAALLQVRDSKPSLEVHNRVEQLLRKLAGPTTDADTLRALRAIEALEQIGTAQAREVLTSMASGAPGVRLTEEAQAALGRLTRRSR